LSHWSDMDSPLLFFFWGFAWKWSSLSFHRLDDAVEGMLLLVSLNGVTYLFNVGVLSSIFFSPLTLQLWSLPSPLGHAHEDTTSLAGTPLPFGGTRRPFLFSQSSKR